MAQSPTLDYQNQVLNNPWAQMMGVGQPPVPGVTQAPWETGQPQDQGRGPASVPQQASPPVSMSIDPTIANDPAVQSYFPSLVPYQQSPEEKELMKQSREAANTQLEHQKQGVGQLEDLLKKRQGSMSDINWSPLASYVDSNVSGSHLTEGANAINQERQRTTDLAEKVQGAQNSMSKDYLQNLSDQIKSAQFGNQMNHQQQVANAQMGKVANAQILGAQRSFNNDKILNVYTPRVDGAVNILRIVDNIGNETDPNKKIQLTAALLQQIDNEKAKLETGNQAVAEGLVSAGSQKIAEADFKKWVTYLTKNIKDIDAPQIMKQNKILISHMLNNYTDAIERRVGTLSAGSTPLQKQVFDAKIQEYRNKYNPKAMLPEVKGMQEDAGGSPVGTKIEVRGTIHTKTKVGPDNEQGNWE